MKEAILERFLRYVAVTSQSDGKAGVVPSTEGQRKLAGMLAEELAELGFVNIEISEYSVLTALLPGNLPDNKAVPTVGWCCHLDTVDAGLSPDVHPQVIRGYQGGDICLNKEKDLWMRTSEHPEIEKYVGDDIVVTDGTSVLGADNKSAIANVMTAFDIVVKENRPHGDIYVAFVPDEEIGLLGAKKIDFSKFPVDFAYTVDGGMEGALEYENFNAASAKIDIQGRNVHPGYAKNKMVNALDVACELQGLLPAAERPQYTEGYEGFYHCVGLNGTVEKASVSYIIRDHDAEKFEQKKVFMWACVDLLKKKYGDGVLTLTLKDQYFNMRKMVEPHPQVIDKALKAMEMAGVNPIVRPIRGGTDGARLSFMGLPCPNLFTGGMNFHGKFEYCSLTTMHKTEQVILNLAQLWAE